MSPVSVPISSMFLLEGECSVPLSPHLRAGSNGGATFINRAGHDVTGLFVYNMPDQPVQLAVWFLVPSARSNGSNNFGAGIIDLAECDHDLFKVMTKGSEKGILKSTKVSGSCSGLVVRSTMSDTVNAVLKVDISNVPLYKKGVKVDCA